MTLFYKELTAILFAFFLFFLSLFLLHTFSPTQSPQIAPDYSGIYRGNDYQNLDNKPINTDAMIKKMKDSLESGIPVLFATSELTGGWATDESQFIPYKFFKEKAGYPIFSFGRAHGQSLTVLAQLAAYSNETMRKNAKVIFVFSPGFLRTDGTNIEAFLDFVPNQLLEKIYFSSDASEEIKKYIGYYVKDNLDKIENKKFIHRYAAMYADGSDAMLSLFSSVEKFKKKFYQNIWKYNDEVVYEFMPNDNSIKSVRFEEGNGLDWSKYESLAQEISEKDSKSNPWGIRDQYFDAYVREESNNATKKIAVPIPVWDEDSPGLVWKDAQYESKEYQDFKMLMEFCKSLEIQPLFVMQDLNPLAYKDYKKHNFSMQRIRDLVDQYGYHYLDLWSYESENYEKGKLVDLMHLGEVGWLQVDREIYKIFIEESR